MQITEDKLQITMYKLQSAEYKCMLFFI